MAKLQFPKVEALSQDRHRNLNGDGGRTQLILSVALLFVITISNWMVFVSKSDAEFNWFGLVLLVASGWYFLRLLNVTMVSYSSRSLLLCRRGKRYEVPYADVASVHEKKPLRGIAILGSNHSRYVTVQLNRQYPFGFSFSFYTKREYGDFDGLSGPAKLIQNYAEASLNSPGSGQSEARNL